MCNKTWSVLVKEIWLEEQSFGEQWPPAACRRLLMPVHVGGNHGQGNHLLSPTSGFVILLRLLKCHSNNFTICNPPQRSELLALYHMIHILSASASNHVYVRVRRVWGHWSARGQPLARRAHESPSVASTYRLRSSVQWIQSAPILTSSWNRTLDLWDFKVPTVAGIERSWKPMDQRSPRSWEVGDRSRNDTVFEEY